jgi:uncharacterized membrane protein
MLDGSSEFNFLLHNLFSGLEPLLIAYLMLVFYPHLGTVAFWVGALLWVLFYPNSPYMISDLIHVSLQTKVPTDSGTIPDAIVDRIVFNVLIIFSFALLSIFYGFISLKIMYTLFRLRYNAKVASTFIIIALLLSCIGFYIGRTIKSEAISTTENLYSANFLFHPIESFNAIWPSLFPSADHPYPYHMMALFGIIQCALLVMMKDVHNVESAELITEQNLRPGKAEAR